MGTSGSEGQNHGSGLLGCLFHQGIDLYRGERVESNQWVESMQCLTTTSIFQKESSSTFKGNVFMYTEYAQVIYLQCMHQSQKLQPPSECAHATTNDLSLTSQEVKDQ